MATRPTQWQRLEKLESARAEKRGRYPDLSGFFVRPPGMPRPPGAKPVGDGKFWLVPVDDAYRAHLAQRNAS